MSAVRTLYDEAQIIQRIDELAADVAKTFPSDFTIVGLLTGAFVFVADLVRALDRVGRTPHVEFMRLSSYGQNRESSRKVKLVGEVPDVKGRDVLLVDDVVDTGRTQAFAREILLHAGA